MSFPDYKNNIPLDIGTTKGSFSLQRKIPFFLVTGFLGSGKTTLLKRILSEHKNKKIAIVQNEFAAANTDGTELKQEDADFKILEVNQGSVFCVCLLGSFIQSMAKFVEAEKPDLIILEASGLSDPIAIAQMLEAKELKDDLFLAYIWTIVDVNTIEKTQKMVQRVTHQIRVADKVILNKIDLIPLDKAAAEHSPTPKLQRIKTLINELNPYATIVEAEYCKIDTNNIESPAKENPVAIEHQDDNAQAESGGKPDIESAVIRSTKRISQKSLDDFLNTHGPLCIRIKGFVWLDDGQVAIIQSSFGENQISYIKNYNGPTEIIGMGYDLDSTAFSRIFK